MQKQLTPLHCASIGGHYDVAQLLLEKGAELDARAVVSIMCLFSVLFIVHKIYFITNLVHVDVLIMG